MGDNRRQLRRLHACTCAGRTSPTACRATSSSPTTSWSARCSCCSGRSSRFRVLHRPADLRGRPRRAAPSLRPRGDDSERLPRGCNRPARRRALRLRARAAPRRHRPDRRRRRGRPRRLRRPAGGRAPRSCPTARRAGARARRLQAAHREGPRALLRAGACGGRWPGRWWWSGRRSATGSACTSPTSRRCAAPLALLDVRPAYVLTDGFPVDGLGVPGPGGVEGRPGRCLHLRGLGAGQGDPGPDHARAARRLAGVRLQDAQGLHHRRAHRGARPRTARAPVHRMRFVNVRRAAGLEPPLRPDPAGLRVAAAGRRPCGRRSRTALSLRGGRVVTPGSPAAATRVSSRWVTRALRSGQGVSNT